MHDLFQVQGLLTVFSDMSTAEAVTHNNILLHLISSSASSCVCRRSQGPRRRRLLTQSIPLPLGAGGWTEGPCMNPSFLIIIWLKHWLCILCTHSFPAGYQFDTIPCSLKDLQGVNHSSDIYYWILWLFKVPSSCWLWISQIHIAETTLFHRNHYSRENLGPSCFPMLSLPGLCFDTHAFCHLLISQILFCTQVDRVLLEMDFLKGLKGLKF